MTNPLKDAIEAYRTDGDAERLLTALTQTAEDAATLDHSRVPGREAIAEVETLIERHNAAITVGEERALSVRSERFPLEHIATEGRPEQVIDAEWHDVRKRSRYWILATIVLMVTSIVLAVLLIIERSNSEDVNNKMEMFRSIHQKDFEGSSDSEVMLFNSDSQVVTARREDGTIIDRELLKDVYSIFIEGDTKHPIEICYVPSSDFMPCEWKTFDPRQSQAFASDEVIVYAESLESATIEFVEPPGAPSISISRGFHVAVKRDFTGTIYCDLMHDGRHVFHSIGVRN